MIEYIDKIIDLRRGLVDQGNVPQSMQKPLKALESRGNPYGKMEKKRADWSEDKEFRQTCKVRILDGKQSCRHFVFCRQHYFLRRPYPGDWARHRQDSRSCRRELRNPGRGGKGQRP